MPKPVIADTSCLIVLQNIGEIDLLRKLYTVVYTTSEVAMEFRDPMPEWIMIQNPLDTERQRQLENEIDKGEASAIALALELPENILILDDFKARKLAQSFGLSVTGTLGVLMKAKRLGKISSMKVMIKKLKDANFRISPALEKSVLRESQES
jgi:predicted nucleic acid-binding protein